MNAIALTFQTTQFDIIDRNNQPWLRLPQIEGALGYTNKGKGLSNVFQRNKDEFTNSMTALVELDTEGGKQQVRVFSLRGCHLLGMLSRTTIAKEFRKWVLDILDNQLSSNSVQLEPETITKAQQGILFNVVAGKSDHSGKGRSYYWSRFANHFKLASYKDLRVELFDEAHHYLQGLEGEEMLYITISELNRVVDSNIKRAIEGQLVEKQSKNSLTIDMRFPEGMRTMNMQFETSEFQHGRWLVSLMDGNLSIQAMPNDVLCLTTDKWIDYMTQERGYVVGKKLN